MSVDGAINFKREKDLRFNPRKTFTNVACLILSCDVVPLSLDAPFGKVASGTLKVCGRALQVPVPQSYEDRHLRDEPMRLQDAKGREHNVGRLHYDTTTTKSSSDGFLSYFSVDTNHGALDFPNQLWCLMICTERHTVEDLSKPVGEPDRTHDEWRPWGLVLAKLPDGTYHRVGYFDHRVQLSHDGKWKRAANEFKKKPPQDLTIA